MRRMLAVHPLRPGAADRYAAFCDELRDRRDELAASRRRVGIARQVFWVQPDLGMSVVRTDADDPIGALTRLASAEHPFDQWYREREVEIHGSPLVEAGAPPELLADHRTGDVAGSDVFVAVALPLLPGRTGSYRAAVSTGREAGATGDRTRRWGVRRMAIWLQRVRGRDVVVYEMAGDIAEMVRVLTGDRSQEVRDQRAVMADHFGSDVVPDGELPLPVPAFAWSAGGVRSDAP